jgi:hypothetical protein
MASTAGAVIVRNRLETWTVQVWVAAGDWFPLPSVADTENVCAPFESDESVIGLEQAVGVAPSSEHRKVTPDSASENAKVTALPLGFGGVWVNAGGGGGAVSTENDLETWGETLLYGSTPSTENVCGPSPSPE